MSTQEPERPRSATVIAPAKEVHYFDPDYQRQLRERIIASRMARILGPLKRVASDIPVRERKPVPTSIPVNVVTSDQLTPDERAAQKKR